MMVAETGTTANTVACLFCRGTGMRNETECNFCFATGEWTEAVAEFHWFNDLQERLAASVAGSTDYDTRRVIPPPDLDCLWAVWDALVGIQGELKREQVRLSVCPSCVGVGCTQCGDRGYEFEIDTTGEVIANGEENEA